MDLNWVNLGRILFTVGVFAGFMLMLIRVLSKSTRTSYDNVAQSIVDDPDTPLYNHHNNHINNNIDDNDNNKINSSHEHGAK